MLCPCPIDVTSRESLLARDKGTPDTKTNQNLKIEPKYTANMLCVCFRVDKALVYPTCNSVINLVSVNDKATMI